MSPSTPSDELIHDCAAAAALLLVELFGAGGPPAELFSQTVAIVSEALIEHRRRMAEVRRTMEPSPN